MFESVAIRLFCNRELSGWRRTSSSASTSAGSQSRFWKNASNSNSLAARSSGWIRIIPVSWTIAASLSPARSSARIGSCGLRVLPLAVPDICGPGAFVHTIASRAAPRKREARAGWRVALGGNGCLRDRLEQMAWAWYRRSMRRLRIVRRWFKRRFGYARLACLALLIAFAALRILDPAPVEEIRVRTFDTFQRFDPRKKAVRPVTIVDIDDKSMEKLGQWPWPRTRIADLVTELTRLGAVVIAFDAVFSEPDRLNPSNAADTFRNLDEVTREKLRLLPRNDQIFADAIKASRFMFDFPGMLRNVPVLEHAAAGRGLFTIRPERDGIVRRVPMIMQAQGQTMPSLTFEMLRVATGSGTILVKAEKAGIKSIGIRGLQIPTDNNGQLWVHYARNDASIYVPAINVLEKNVAPDMIAGKLVLIGTSAVGLNDIKTTPVSRAMPGVEIHAQVLESPLTGALLSQPIYGLGHEC